MARLFVRDQCCASTPGACVRFAARHGVIDSARHARRRHVDVIGGHRIR